MPRKNRSSDDFSLIDFLTGVPAWVGPVLAIVVYISARWIVPWAASLTPSLAEDSPPILHGFGFIVERNAHYIAFLVIMVWLAAEIAKFKDRRRLDSQAGTEDIRTLDWREFERLLGEAFRREGFAVKVSGKPRADGGVDLRLNKAGEITLVQCKHWKSRRVGVTVVRELLGVMTSDGAHFGIVVTSGGFTSEAREFASTNPIRLIDGDGLQEMIAKVRRGGTVAVAVPRAEVQATQDARDASADPLCPTCGSPMILRTAKKGSNAGSQFLGCSLYPQCRGTRPVPS